MRLQLFRKSILFNSIIQRESCKRCKYMITTESESSESFSGAAPARARADVAGREGGGTGGQHEQSAHEVHGCLYLPEVAAPRSNEARQPCLFAEHQDLDLQEQYINT